MGLYNFQPRFEEPIVSGRKTHTIRGKRKHPDVPGNTLHLYVGLRHKGARKLLAPICTRVEDILIEDSGRRFQDVQPLLDGRRLFGPYPAITIAEIGLSDDEMETLAWRDGFSSLWEMISFWDGRLPYNGDLIHWRFPQEGA